MINYKIVKYCRMCRVRFVVFKAENKKIYCEKCQKQIGNKPWSEVIKM